MPELTRWPEADDLLDRALALPPGERHAFLRAAAGHDAALLKALEAVIAEAVAQDGFLEPGGALSGPLGDDVKQDLGASAGADVLQPGARVAQYEIHSLVGRGGMGEVYRARDVRLRRDVALKVLPASVARNPERIARFQREAQVLASLSHPGIGAIYGIAEDGDTEALVLEYVPGPTLADRIAGQPLPMDEALAIARRLAEAIEAAHARGILHRDLKPANIKALPGGSVKILDFGLAKALAPAHESTPGTVDLTMAAPGSMLGTAPYMSPEQARGHAVDERTDIWAFGCVLFEMLTGVRAFAGGTHAEVIARVLEREPPFGLLPAGTPEPVRRLLRRCLEKEPRRRLSAIADALLELDDATVAAIREIPDEPSRPRWLAPLLLAAGMLAGAVLAFMLLPRQTPAQDSAWRLSVILPSGDAPVTSYQPSLAVSPDGRSVVYRARRNGVVQLFRRDLHDLEPVPIDGTQDATSPFFSPDGRWLAFDVNGVLRRMPFEGGAPVVIGDAPGGATAAWGPGDTVVFATNTGRVLQRVSASGGTPENVTSLDPTRGDTLHLLPQLLSDGRTVVFTIAAGAQRLVAATRMGTSEVTVVTEGTHARYLPGGYLLFVRSGTLWGAPFDLESLSLQGPPAPLVDGIDDTDNTVYHYDVSPEGTLVYLPPGQTSSLQQLVWFDREGRQAPVDLEPRNYTRVALSPDGSRIALTITERGNTDIWIAEPARRSMTRLTFDPSIESTPIWSPDGKFVAFRSERQGPGLFRRDAQGAGVIERITETDGPIHSPYSWTPDGQSLLLALFRSFSRQAIARVTPPQGSVEVLLDGEFAQLDPQVSPDGRWMAYQSDETGRFEVYVRPYPDVQSARWQVSSGGGFSPRWRADGRELFYYDGSALRAAPVREGEGFRVEPASRLFDVVPYGARLGPAYAVSPDGNRFLFIVDGPGSTPSVSQLVVVRHWAVNLRRSRPSSSLPATSPR